MKINAKFHIEKGTFLLDVDLSFPASGVTALFGPSGCGKTTLLRAMAGLDRHADGFLTVGKQTWQDESVFLPPHERPIGYVFQEPSLFPHLTVHGNLSYGSKRVRPEDRSVSFEQAIDLVSIGELLDRYPHQLSGGERQRVAIARALAVSPQLLLMDEPLASLDQAKRQEILPYLEDLYQRLKIPVIYVSHETSEVARLADHMILLDGGKVLASGPVAELFTRLDLPLSHESDAKSIIEATVAAHDEPFHLTYLDFDGGRFTVSRSDFEIGKFVRLQVAARDVSLTASSHSDTSILNIFPATVEEMGSEGLSQTTVRLSVGGVPLLARITRKSAESLDLQVGSTVFAQVKSVALLA